MILKYVKFALKCVLIALSALVLTITPLLLFTFGGAWAVMIWCVLVYLGLHALVYKFEELSGDQDVNKY